MDSWVEERLWTHARENMVEKSKWFAGRMSVFSFLLH